MLEIENILRGVGDIRLAMLAIEPKIVTAEQKKIKLDLRNLVEQTEFTVRILEFELEK